MVSNALRLHWFSLVTIFLFSLSAIAAEPSSPESASVSAPSSLDYKIGDVATEEVIAPVPMVVIDQDETIALKKAEAARVQVICRFYTNRANEAEERFRKSFANAHSNFLNAVESAFKRQELTAQDVGSQKFERLIGSFQRRNKSFPLTTNLAEMWARGESDRVMQSSLSARLREAMIRPIRAGGQPVPKFTFSVRLVTMTNDDEVLTLEEADRRGRLSPRANIVQLSKAKSDLVESFPPEEEAVGKYLASMLRTNLVADMELTDKARAKRTEALWAADRYEAGQVIVKRGEVIDRKIKSALNQLREKAAIGSLQERVQMERSNALKAEQRVETERAAAQKAHEQDQVALATAHAAELRNRWLFGGAGVIFFLIVVVLALGRRKPSESLLPATIPSGQPVLSLPNAQTAEMRERLIPHLARVLTGRFVQKLISQRTDLIDTQKRAAAEMTELEDRLEKIHAPLQDRLRAYQQRITELEKELATKGEENRELTKAKIELARKHLAETEDQLGLN
jgi:hypothetical protein